MFYVGTHCPPSFSIVMLIVVHTAVFLECSMGALKPPERKRNREGERMMHTSLKTAVKLWLNYKGNPLGLQSSMACREELFMLDKCFIPKTNISPATVHLKNKSVVNHITCLTYELHDIYRYRLLKSDDPQC